MDDRPILFSGPMVRAILEGRKTQTRRVLKPQPSDKFAEAAEKIALRFPHSVTVKGFAVGDLLWVREAWRIEPGGHISDGAGGQMDYVEAGIEYGGKGHGWKSPRFMKREYSRITLRVTGVRVHRLQDITLRDVWAEGVEVRQFALFGSDKEGRDKIGRFHFWPVWDSINAKRPGCAWDDNPWVAAITFEQCSENGGSLNHADYLVAALEADDDAEDGIARRPTCTKPAPLAAASTRTK